MPSFTDFLVPTDPMNVMEIRQSVAPCWYWTPRNYPVDITIHDSNAIVRIIVAKQRPIPTTTKATFGGTAVSAACTCKETLSPEAATVAITIQREVVAVARPKFCGGASKR